MTFKFQFQVSNLGFFLGYGRMTRAHALMAFLHLFKRLPHSYLSIHTYLNSQLQLPPPPLLFLSHHPCVRMRMMNLSSISIFPSMGGGALLYEFCIEQVELGFKNAR